MQHRLRQRDRLFVVQNGRATERVIQILDRSERAVLIERGVNPGDQVVVDGVADPALADLQLLVLGTGESSLEQAFSALAARHHALSAD